MLRVDEHASMGGLPHRGWKRLLNFDALHKWEAQSPSLGFRCMKIGFQIDVDMRV